MIGGVSFKVSFYYLRVIRFLCFPKFRYDFLNAAGSTSQAFSKSGAGDR